MLFAAAVFGSKHIIGLVIVIILVIAAMMFVEKKEVKKEKVLVVATIGFLVIEVTKLTFITIDDGVFPLYHIPLHLCSLPLYLYPIIVWSNNEKVKQFVIPASFATILFGGMIALLYPSNILGSEDTWAFTKNNFLPYISFIYHGIMIFAPIYLLRSGIYKIKGRHIKEAYIVSLIFMLIAIIVNYVLDKDFMLLHYGNGSPFQFLREVSPLLYTSVMIVLGLIAIAVFHFVTVLVRKDVVE
jgi:uncharacterized membrane protein YwaF